MYIRDYTAKENPLPPSHEERNCMRIVSLENLHEVVTYTPTGPFDNGKGAVMRHDNDHRDSPKNTWYGCTPAEADRRLAHGWTEGGAKILDLDLYDLPTPRIIKRTRIWTDEGDELSLDRLYRGDTETMWQRMAPRERVGTLRVTLFAELGINCNVDQKVLFWRGATTLRLADLLQRAGYAVRILVGASTRHLAERRRGGSGTEYLDTSFYWTAKSYADPLDIDNLAVTIASAAFFRRQIFRQFDNLPEGQKWEQSWGLGQSSVSLSDAVAQMLADENGDLLIKTGERVADAATANEWLKSLAVAMPQIFDNN